MLIGRPTGPNVIVIGKSQGYLGLPVRFIEKHDNVAGGIVPCLETCWIPTPDEIERIIAGAPIVVQLLTRQHPPILLYVGDEPNEETTSCAT